MREPAATPIIRREDRKAARGSITLSQTSLTDARAARLALERLLETDPPPDLPAGFGDAVERYVALLLEANRRVNLTRVVEPEPVARLHLLDALAALPLVDAIEPGRALDLGSGGGVPGIVLAMARPRWSWTLVDSVRKKADALRSFVDALELSNVEVVAERAETLGRDPARRESFSLVTARACAALPVLVEYAIPMMLIGGTLVAWKGPITSAELAAGASASGLLGGGRPSVHPSGHDVLGDHRFVRIGKERATPDAYPRRPGEPARRPLGS
jgi:16S rRNA (guanine527-N7)-methyltransferase